MRMPILKHTRLSTGQAGDRSGPSLRLLSQLVPSTLFVPCFGQSPQRVSAEVVTQSPDTCRAIDFSILGRQIRPASPMSVTKMPLQIFEDEHKFVCRLKVDTAYHSHQMRACAAPYLDGLKKCNIPKADGSGPLDIHVFTRARSCPGEAQPPV